MSAYDKALALLSLREHSEKEIREKLEKRNFEKAEIEEAVERLTSENLLSDERFARNYIESRLKANPEGRDALVMRLRQKGVSSDLANKEVSEAWQSGDYIPHLKRKYEREERKRGGEKAMAFLLSKGFKKSEIERALSFEEEE